MPGRNGGWAVVVALVLVVGLGFGLRLASALDPVVDPGRDAIAYERISEGLYKTGRYGNEKMHSPTDWSPGAPLFYTGVYFLTGGVHPEAARIAVALMGMAMILMVYLLGRRLAGPLGGLFAALLAAIYPTFIENTGQLLTEPIAAFTLAAAMLGFLWASDRMSLFAWVVPGLLLGYTALTRPEYLVFSAVFALLVLCRTARARTLWAGVAAAVVFLLAFAVPLAPWTVRNYMVLGHFVPVTTGGGKALFVATYLPGRGRQVPTKRELILRYPEVRLEQFRGDKVVRLAELKATEMNRLLNQVAKRYPGLDRDAALARAGRANLRKYVTEQPMAYLGMTIEKVWNMWRRGSSPAMRGTGWLVFHRAVVLLALVGLGVLAWRRRWEALVLGVVVVGITLLGALLLAVPRRNVPLMPLEFALAAAGVSWLVSILAARLSGSRASPQADLVL